MNPQQTKSKNPATKTNNCKQDAVSQQIKYNCSYQKLSLQGIQ